MWLLRTDCAEVRWFTSPQDVPIPGYAILSHVWGTQEQSFQRTPQLSEVCAESERSPSYDVSAKIREFCIVARRDGYQWAWADTCCIDKSSSAELSEAINSMYEYYAHAAVCYAYLADVSTPLGIDDRPFRRSKWHSRGWTLQELLAPAAVVFLAADWRVLGTKVGLARHLAAATGIPEQVLALKTDVADISIAGRMSWASKRKTTRVEDEAYCLMGIFGINMPTLYGEGRAAFTRLQEEIMKRSTDTSLFAWGRNGNLAMNDIDISCFVPAGQNAASDLLASTPSVFADRSGISFVPNQRPDIVPPGQPTFAPSAHGILSYVPVIKRGDRVFGAFLLCTDSKDEERWHVALILRECSDATCPLGHLYDAGGEIDGESYRLFSLDLYDDTFRSIFTVQWQQIYIAHRRRHFSSRVVDPQIRLLNHALLPSFHIPRSLDISSYATPTALFPHLTNPIASMLVLMLRPGWCWDKYLVLRFGRCTTSTTHRAPFGGGIHWARITYHLSELAASHMNPGFHDCHRDHISDWVRRDPNGSDVPLSRVFFFCPSLDDPYVPTKHYVTLSFTPSHTNSDLLVLTGLLFSAEHPFPVQNEDDDAVELEPDPISMDTIESDAPASTPRPSTSTQSGDVPRPESSATVETSNSAASTAERSFDVSGDPEGWRSGEVALGNGQTQAPSRVALSIEEERETCGENREWRARQPDRGSPPASDEDRDSLDRVAESAWRVRRVVGRLYTPLRWMSAAVRRVFQVHRRTSDRR